jgi:hypothetical protein
MSDNFIQYRTRDAQFRDDNPGLQYRLASDLLRSTDRKDRLRAYDLFHKFGDSVCCDKLEEEFKQVHEVDSTGSFTFKNIPYKGRLQRIQTIHRSLLPNFSLAEMDLRLGVRGWLGIDEILELSASVAPTILRETIIGAGEQGNMLLNTRGGFEFVDDNHSYLLINSTGRSKTYDQAYEIQIRSVLGPIEHSEAINRFLVYDSVFIPHNLLGVNSDEEDHRLIISTPEAWFDE